MKALDAIFEVMNVSRSHLMPNLPLREVFEEDFKSLKPEALQTLARLLPKPQVRAQPDEVVISTLFYSGFMRWLSKFLGALHIELNTEDLERCKLIKSEISRTTQFGGMSVSGSSLSSLSSSDYSERLEKLEQIDPEYDSCNVDDDDDDIDIIIDGEKADDDDDDDDDDKNEFVA